MSGSMIQIVVLAGIALFLVLQLRNVLGTRDGFEPPRDAAAKMPNGSGDARDFEVIDGGAGDQEIAAFVDEDSDAAKALSSMKAIEPSFSIREFVDGARQAYEMILMAFENGDRDTLQAFLSDDVFAGFDAAITDREEKNLTVEATFVGVREIKVADAEFDSADNSGELIMRFVGELTSVVKDEEGRIIEGDPNEIKRQRDIWTFARTMGSDDPNWTLVATER